jgi:hypothetical protein
MMPATFLSCGTGGDRCLVRSQGWWWGLVPAVNHEFIYSTCESVRGLDSSEEAHRLLLALTLGWVGTSARSSPGGGGGA